MTTESNNQPEPVEPDMSPLQANPDGYTYPGIGMTEEERKEVLQMVNKMLKVTKEMNDLFGPISRRLHKEQKQLEAAQLGTPWNDRPEALIQGNERPNFWVIQLQRTDLDVVRSQFKQGIVAKYTSVFSQPLNDSWGK